MIGGAYPARMEPLIDPHGRRVTDLRVSITDRCNFRCTYCMPEEGMAWLPRNDLLSYEELTRVAGIMVEHFGFDSIRLTGGEPTVRAHLPVLIEKLSALRTRVEAGKHERDSATAGEQCLGRDEHAVLAVQSAARTRDARRELHGGSGRGVLPAAPAPRARTDRHLHPPVAARRVHADAGPTRDGGQRVVPLGFHEHLHPLDRVPLGWRAGDAVDGTSL